MPYEDFEWLIRYTEEGLKIKSGLRITMHVTTFSGNSVRRAMLPHTTMAKLQYIIETP